MGSSQKSIKQSEIFSFVKLSHKVLNSEGKIKLLDVSVFVWELIYITIYSRSVFNFSLSSNVFI
jgi:hypothetical protein